MPHVPADIPLALLPKSGSLQKQTKGIYPTANASTHFLNMRNKAALKRNIVLPLILLL